MINISVHLSTPEGNRFPKKISYWCKPIFYQSGRWCFWGRTHGFLSIHGLSQWVKCLGPRPFLYAPLFRDPSPRCAPLISFLMSSQPSHHSMVPHRQIFLTRLAKLNIFACMYLQWWKTVYFILQFHGPAFISPALNLENVVFSPVIRNVLQPILQAFDQQLNNICMYTWKD